MHALCARFVLSFLTLHTRVASVHTESCFQLERVTIHDDDALNDSHQIQHMASAAEGLNGGQAGSATLNVPPERLLSKQLMVYVNGIPTGALNLTASETVSQRACIIADTSSLICLRYSHLAVGCSSMRLATSRIAQVDLFSVNELARKVGHIQLAPCDSSRASCNTTSSSDSESKRIKYVRDHACPDRFDRAFCMAMLASGFCEEGIHREEREGCQGTCGRKRACSAPPDDRNPMLLPTPVSIPKWSPQTSPSKTAPAAVDPHLKYNPSTVALPQVLTSPPEEPVWGSRQLQQSDTTSFVSLPSTVTHPSSFVGGGGASYAPTVSWHVVASGKDVAATRSERRLQDLHAVGEKTVDVDGVVEEPLW